MPKWAVIVLFIMFGIAGGVSAQSSRIIIIASTSEPWIPFFKADQNGSAEGYMHELLVELLENQMGYEIKYLTRPWRRAQMEVKQGNADLMLTVATDARKQYTLVSDQALMNLSLTFYVHSNHPKMSEIEHIYNVEQIRDAGLRLVTNFGNGWYEQNVLSKGVKTQFVLDEKAILFFVAGKRADGFIENEVSMEYLMERYNMNHRLVKTDLHFGPIPFHLLLSKKSTRPELLDEINQALSDPSVVTALNKIHSKYTHRQFP